MDQDTLRQSQQVLTSMITDRRLRVGFLLDQHGRLITHSGTAPSFHPQGQFPAEAPGDKAGGENVYMTGIDEAFILGAIFDEESNIDSIREIVEPHRNRLKDILALYITRR